MSRTAKVTSKGQITLPASMRAELDIRPGDSIVFFRHLDGRTSYTVDRRRDRPVAAIASHSGPPLDVRALDPATPAEQEPSTNPEGGARRAAR